MAGKSEEHARVRGRLAHALGRAGPALDDGAGSGPTHRDAVGAEPASVPSIVDPADAFGPVTGDDGGFTRQAARFDPGRRGWRALAVVAVLVLAGAAVLAWQARPTTERLPPRLQASAGSEVPGQESVAAVVVVAVTGRVRRPGLVRLPAGARVADAIDAAGGVVPGTDLSMVNLARKLVDGELIAIGVTPPAAPEAGAGGAPAAGGRINLNTATLAELDTLPGVGPVLAQRILDHRLRHGPFRAVSDLRRVDGFGDARFEQLKDLVTV